ncbi:peptidoglycan-binding domain-containing protein [Demetria terragena]|uniref:peptidoglycan-binding domain-containing protein n=1 Tax=Demetria terragena TaxID=63959 RepID=UPI000366DBEC|nr:peptidoglycan-binding protein [Demetria terragena]
MDSIIAPSRRTLLLGGTGAAALGFASPSAAFADNEGKGRKGYGAPSTSTTPSFVGGDGGPRPGGLVDKHGFPLPGDPKALPNSRGAVSGAPERVRNGVGRAPVSLRSGPGATRLAASSVPNYHATAFPTIGPGAGFYDLRALQYLLLAEGYKSNWETSYGATTKASVTAYQKKKGLSATGTADPKTIEKLAVNTGKGAVSYRVYAIQSLLRKHGYQFRDGKSAPEMSTNYGPLTTKYVRCFQAGHAIGPDNFVGYYTWRTLFAAKTSGPMYALMQYQTGDAQWANCGPVSAVSLLIHRGVTPRKWVWNISLRTAAVEDFRYNAMGVPNTAARDKKGTEFPEFSKAFPTYGIKPTHGGINDTIAKAKAGIGSIAGGDAHTLPWDNYVNGPVSHWVAVLGWDGKYFLMMDPITKTSADEIHRVTEAQLRKYASTNPGHPQSTAAKNSIILP